MSPSLEAPSDDADAPMPSTLDRAMQTGEQILYLGIGLLLFVCAMVALSGVAHGFADHGEDGALAIASTALDGLLLVFIFVELFGAVRATMSERVLLAEPFLVVGIIASIKAIIVASLALESASGEKFDDLVTKVGVLGAVILLLAISTLLIRRKEREPAEHGE